MSGLSFMDSSALGAIVRADRELSAAGGVLAPAAHDSSAARRFFLRQLTSAAAPESGN